MKTKSLNHADFLPWSFEFPGMSGFTDLTYYRAQPL